MLHGTLILQPRSLAPGALQNGTSGAAGPMN
eukprot:CAMPEP_0174322568 /NCGR_PEP_ID=MMETSP0810-20121108/11084_1 /TAXON_ID=73025 ORGANISM="Eutreptiella gymnastica-like, Strain CCMP1594" /NCGR_SAMPLE_ID=MMETSP0810 /ASSEMBLY_ACC=CAM_ASM_000659 /LENGTH=30 /DNA_ID= /DNA_START= /DNA_END= /DNA_ORIENTATION=